MAGTDAGLAGWIVRHRRGIIAVWIAAAAAALPLAGFAARVFDVSATVPGSESQAVERELAGRFGSPFARFVLLVVSGVPDPATDAGAAALRRISTAITPVPGVTRATSVLDTPDSLLVANGGSLVLIGMAPDAARADAAVAGIRAAVAPLRDSLRLTHPAAALELTGETALNADLRLASAADATHAERRALPLTVALLVAAFGSVVAALLAATAGVVAIVVATALAVAIAAFTPLSILLQNVIAMLGLGLGIDYALVITSRFRESRDLGHGVEQAATDAVRHAGHTVLVSGAAVAIGLLALTAIPASELRSIGVGGVLVVAVSVLVATTLLPAVLASLGPRVDAWRVRRLARASGADSRWSAWGRRVAAHPKLVLLAAGAPVLFLAAQAPRLTTSLPRGDWLPPGMESARALRRLQTMGRAGLVQTIRVVAELPPGVTAFSPEGWTAVAALTARWERDPRIARVRSLPALAGRRAPSAVALSLLDPDVRRSLVTMDERATALDLVPRDDADPVALMALVREIRAGSAAPAGPRALRLRVGGLPAFNLDYAGATSGYLPAVVLFVLTATWLALALAFRSVLLPLKAVLLNLLSVAASLGAVVLVFQDGHALALVGLTSPLDGNFPAIPVLVFAIVFGLSMDYEVFLLARVAEARAAGAGETEALATGLGRSAGVITSAAAIMVGVFAAFVAGDFLLIKILGFALSVAVALDATIVRLAIGPALLCLAGRWNWWPGRPAGRPAVPPLAAGSVPAAPPVAVVRQ
jgi:RND superfamily putative drug exporter